MDPCQYYRTLPEIEDLEEVDIDYWLAKELFMGEYDLSLTQEPSEFSMKDLEQKLFGSPGSQVLLALNPKSNDHSLSQSPSINNSFRAPGPRFARNPLVEPTVTYN
jgi:hypothetical protein